MKENQIPRVKEFNTFLCLGRYKSLGSLKSFLLYASQLLGPASGFGASQVVLVAKNPPANGGDAGLIPGLGKSPEEGMVAHSTILA